MLNMGCMIAYVEYKTVEYSLYLLNKIPLFNPVEGHMKAVMWVDYG